MFLTASEIGNKYNTFRSAESRLHFVQSTFATCTRVPPCVIALTTNFRTARPEPRTSLSV